LSGAAEGEALGLGLGEALLMAGVVAFGFGSVDFSTGGETPCNWQALNSSKDATIAVRSVMVGSLLLFVIFAFSFEHRASHARTIAIFPHFPGGDDYSGGSKD
jgi:hypothetical protein